MAPENGCSLGNATAAAAASNSRSPVPGAGRTCCTCGRPSVRVPVLSTTRVSAVLSTSMAVASRNSTPRLAPRPVATMIDIGVARPSAQGQAMMSTDTALSSARVRPGAGPNASQATKVTAAMAMTAGTNTAETASAMR